MTKSTMNPEDLSRLIEMAWEDRTPFDAIFKQYGLTENEVMRLMQKISNDLLTSSGGKESKRLV